MKKTKKLLIIALGVVMINPLFQSCKKGENDPFISFKSRDKRLAQTWKLTLVDGSTINEDPGANPGETTTSTTTYDGTTLKFFEIMTFDDGTPTDTLNDDIDAYTFEMTIDKNGSVTSKSVKNGTDVIESTGEWYWVNDGKNKSSININFINADLITLTKTFVVDELRSKQLTLKFSFVEINTIDGVLDKKDSESLTYTFEKQK